jgi:protease I
LNGRVLKVKVLPMTQSIKIAALVADGFQEEEFFFPKIALNRAGYAVEVVSLGQSSIEMYSFFRRTGLLDVDRTLNDARTEEYAGILIPGGAKSPGLLADDARARAFVQEVDRRGMMVASICRGALLPVKTGIARGRRITGFNDAATYPALVVGPHAIEAGAIWIDGEPVVRDGRLVSSPHPDFSDVFGAEMVRVLAEQADAQAAST